MSLFAKEFCNFDFASSALLLSNVLQIKLIFNLQILFFLLVKTKSQMDRIFVSAFIFV